MTRTKAFFAILVVAILAGAMTGCKGGGNPVTPPTPPTVTDINLISSRPPVGSKNLPSGLTFYFTFSYENANDFPLDIGVEFHNIKDANKWVGCEGTSLLAVVMPRSAGTAEVRKQCRCISKKCEITHILVEMSEYGELNNVVLKKEIAVDFSVVGEKNRT